MTVIAALLIAQASATQAAAPETPPPSCDGEAYAAFDFWVGEWDVYPNGQPEKLVAHSLIERKSSGCAIVENWMPLSGNNGTSLSNFDPDTGRWYQKWVGSAPGAVEFVGGPVDGEMVVTGYWKDGAGPGIDALVRMTYTASPDGSVRQHGEQSLDHGVTWGPSFDFIYRPHQAATD